MQWFYDGQVRRYITQTIRVFSNFVVKYGDGTLVRVPVMYGDADRAVASIIRNNSENKINSVPRISVYVSSLALDRERTSDATFVSKMNFRERDVDATDGAYTTTQGRNYTVERLMPTPFKLDMKIDIWTANTDQKLQLLEQILVLFNPSLELQTTDNYIDWTSLTVLDLKDINWDSRQVPVGADTPIDISTLTVSTPIWISPPVKVKHLGVITKIISSMYSGSTTSPTGYIEGLGEDLAGQGTTNFSDALAVKITAVSEYTIQVYNNQAILLSPTEGYIPREPTLQIPQRQGAAIDWNVVLSQYPGKFIAGSTRLFLTQKNGNEVVATVALNTNDTTVLLLNLDPDTLVANTGIDSNGILEGMLGYNSAGSFRPNSPGTFDAIVNPQTYTPTSPTTGQRFLIIEDIGSSINPAGTGARAWQGTAGIDLIARANDIIEYNGTTWNVLFHAAQNNSTMVWQTNIYTGVQYLWNGVSWVKSFEGEYNPGTWRLEM